MLNDMLQKKITESFENDKKTAAIFPNHANKALKKSLFCKKIFIKKQNN